MSQVFELSRQLDKIVGDRPYRPYHEFLRIPAMSVGMYVLPAGAVDHQRPHQEDEIYYVVRGKSKMQLGKEQRSVKEGDVIFVEPGLEHRFFDIEQDMVLLVVFAPAETT
jgi:quercetin dioxygenase-like cupin family protein